MAASYIVSRNLLYKQCTKQVTIWSPEGYMSAQQCSRVFLLAFVICFPVLLYLATSILSISILRVFEVFLLSFGVLLIVWLVSKVDDQIHLHEVRQKHREIALQRQRQQRPPFHAS